MNPPRLLIAESQGFDPAAEKILRDHFDVTMADLERAALIGEVAEAEILWVRLRHHIDREVMQAGRSLRAIATNTTGLTHIDQEAAAELGIQIVSLQGETKFLQDIRATAEHTIALTLALLRKIPAAAKHVGNGEWDRSKFQGREIFQSTVGIIGYGRLGRIVARYFMSLGAQVVIASRGMRTGDKVNDCEVMALQDLLARSDIVSLHANYEPANHHLLSHEQFHRMQRHAILINTARGELIDESALLDALHEHRIAGAALDVLEDEHIEMSANSQLIAFANATDRLLITPHIGGNTDHSLARTERFLAEKLVRIYSS